MARFHADVALLTDHRYLAEVAAEGDWYLNNILSDDRLLADALSELGLSSERIDWSRPGVDWSKFRCAVFRTTWDYFDRYAEFSAWLNRISQQTRVLNDLSLIRWNIDKHYLNDLSARGVNVVSSHFFERGQVVDLKSIMLENGWHEGIIKPCVSGAARHTYRIDAATTDSINKQVNELLNAEGMILQPFQADVLLNGETSLMVFDGRFTHAVKKIPRMGDFRVQDDHGGTVSRHTATADEIAFAEQAIKACPLPPIYGRVDVVRDNQGQLAIMELELIEPELWLREYPPAATAFAQAISKSLAD